MHGMQMRNPLLGVAFLYSYGVVIVDNSTALCIIDIENSGVIQSNMLTNQMKLYKKQCLCFILSVALIG